MQDSQASRVWNGGISAVQVHSADLSGFPPVFALATDHRRVKTGKGRTYKKAIFVQEGLPE